MRWLRRVRCWLFGHCRNIEDMGGVVFEVCDRCPWVGRHREYPIRYSRMFDIDQEPD